MNKRMRELVDLLNRASYEYYTLDAPTMSDREWDGLYRELEELEKAENTVLPDSPTRRVGGAVLTEFPPHTHIARLWSMNKAQSHEELSENAATFAWVHAENGENGPTTAWVYDEEEATAPSDSRVVSIPMRHQVA